MLHLPLSFTSLVQLQTEAVLTSDATAPVLTVKSTKAGSKPEFTLEGGDKQVKMYHDTSADKIHFCKPKAATNECDSFLTASTNGQETDVISRSAKATFTVQHAQKGGKESEAQLKLVTRNDADKATPSILFNRKGTVGFKTDDDGKDLFTVSPGGDAKVSGTFFVEKKATFKHTAQFDHNVNVEGIVTMEGKSINKLFEDMETTRRESTELRRRMEDMDDENKELRNRLVEMQQTNLVTRERMDRMMQTLTLMQQTMAQA